MKKRLIACCLTGMLLLTGCGGSAVMEIGNHKVSDDTYQYFYKSISPYYPDSEQEAEDAVKKQIKLMYAYIAVGDAMGRTPKEGAFDSYKKQMVSAYGGEQKYKAALKQQGMTPAVMDDITKSQLYKQELLEYIEENQPATQEELDAYFKSKFRRAKHVLIQTDAGMTEEQKAEKKALAEEILARAKNGEEFDSLVSQYSQDPGSAQNPDGYVFTDFEMRKEFQEGVDSIGINELTIAQTDYGYHVIKRLALDETPELYQKFFGASKDKITQGAAQEKLDRLVLDKLAEYQIPVSE